MRIPPHRIPLEFGAASNPSMKLVSPSFRGSRSKNATTSKRGVEAPNAGFGKLTCVHPSW